MVIEKRGETELGDGPDTLSVRGLTYEEAFAILDTQARGRLSMPGEEFLRRWRAGSFSQEFKDEHHSDFVFLSLMAMPFGR